MSEPIRFRVTRTSLRGNMGQPCPESTLESSLHHEEWYKYKSFDDFKREEGEDFLRVGVHHGVIKDEHGTPEGIAREYVITGWYVTLETLSDLLAFIDRHDRIIMDKEPTSNGPLIEIYDAYE